MAQRQGSLTPKRSLEDEGWETVSTPQPGMSSGETPSSTRGSSADSDWVNVPPRSLGADMSAAVTPEYKRETARLQFEANKPIPTAMTGLQSLGEGITSSLSSIPGSLYNLAKVGLTGNASAMPGVVQGAVHGVIDPAIHYVQALQRGDPDAAAYAGGEALVQTVPAVYGAKSLAADLANRIPNVERAGANFQTVMGAAGNVPLDTTAAEQVAARGSQLGERGSTVPKVIRDFIRNRAAASAPMTYEAGRDFASNAGALSGEEVTAINKQMQRQTTQFAQALHDANRGAAVQAGMGDLYDSAMREYGRAMKLSEISDWLQKTGWKWGIGALLGGGAVGGAVKALR